jgi:alpha-mannosidase
MPTPTKTIHLIANAHLDPVWLWDWREGLVEGVATSRAILDIMDQDPALTFIRGEASIYDYIERHDPPTFARIAKRVREGRWEVVGGSWVQSDHNLTGTEAQVRQFTRSRAYFRSRFGVEPRVAWSADSFGHPAGLPEILTHAGMDGFVYVRPQEHLSEIKSPAFWWESATGARVLAYRTPTGGAGSERDSVTRQLDHILGQMQRSELRNWGFGYGLGNHGGMPSRRQIADIFAWAARHPEIRVEHSGLQWLLDAIRAEPHARALPVHRGELNFTLRGCYASVQKFKNAYKRAENDLAGAERTDVAIAAGLGHKPAELGALWDDVAFNSFHDILPGTSIERAYEDQLAWIGGTWHRAIAARHEALSRLATRMNTSVHQVEGDNPNAVPMLVWNPLPHPIAAHVELSVMPDYRPVWAYTNRVGEMPMEMRGADGRALPFQSLANEDSYLPNYTVRTRALVKVDLPPLGWQLLTFGYLEGAERPRPPSPVRAADDERAVENGLWRVEAEPGSEEIRLLRDGRNVFPSGGLRFVTVEDPYGAWGGLGDERESYIGWRERTRWRIEDVRVTERGPERATLWVRLAGGRSTIVLTLSVARDRDAVDAKLRLLLDERSARLRLVMPAGDDAEFEVPGGSIRRGPAGEVPGGRWARVRSAAVSFGFASAQLSSFACEDGALVATIARASRYADSLSLGPDDQPWLPAVDRGELRFDLLFTTGDDELPRRARELVSPPVAEMVAAKPARRGQLPRSGSLLELAPTSLSLLALKRAEDGKGLVLRVQETAGVATAAMLTIAGRKLRLGRIAANAIASWRLTARGKSWKATPCDGLERAPGAKRGRSRTRRR